MPVLTGSFQMYSLGAYTLVNNDWGRGGLVIGKDYTQQISFNDDDINHNVVMTWRYPSAQAPQGVYAYPEIVWGAQNGGVGNIGSKAFAKQISNIKSLVVDYNVSIGGQTGLFDVGIEIWTTNVPPSQSGAVRTGEIMVKVHGWKSDGQSDGDGPTVENSQIGISGEGTSIEVIHPNWGSGPPWTFVTIDTTSDLLSGQIDFAPILKRLVAAGVINSSHYVSGVELGSEMQSGSGSLTVHHFSVVEK